MTSLLFLDTENVRERMEFPCVNVIDPIRLEQSGSGPSHWLSYEKTARPPNRWRKCGWAAINRCRHLLTQMMLHESQHNVT